MKRAVALPSSCWRGASLAALSAGLLLGLSPARAQDADAAPSAADEQVASEEAPEASDEAIVVTGSRIARSGFTAPTPVTVVGEAQIARQGASNIAQVLNEIPAFRAQSTPSTTAIFVSNLGASTADLRGLGGNRTLVLIDGRRVVASTVAGGSFTPANTVDLNLVPSSLLQRVDVVTGGASAVYGSDAVAGVTNLIINRDLTGFRGSVQYGISDEGDNQEFLGSLAYGTRFGDDRGRFIIGAEYVDNKGTGDCYTRAWCAESYNTVANPFVAGSTTQRVFEGQPATLILPNARTATATLNGIILSLPQVPAALRGLEFNPNGTTFAHDYGIYARTGVNAGLFQSGGGDPVLPFYQFFPISAPSERINIFSNLDYDVTDDLNLFVQGSYGRVEGEILGASRRDVGPAGSYQIQRDNAFLPASVSAQMAPGTTLPFGRVWNDIGPQVGHVERETYRAVGGFNWKVGAGWAVDGYYQYGQTDYSQRGENTTVNSRMGFAIDSVDEGLLTTGVANGNIVCRATIPGLPTFRAGAAGCVPLNPFGAGASSAAARDYVTETAMQTTSLKQHVVALTVRGDLLDLWAGPLSFAGGAEYRKEIVSSEVDAISAANDFHTSPGGGIVGGRQSLNVKEGFAELSLPLARDLPFVRSAELNGAVRITDYSNSGTVETWKIGADWEPFEFLRFRGTRSRDIRAPNLFELYGAPQSSFQSITDTGRTGSQFLVPTLLGGNPNLVPEVADTWTAGAIVTGRFGSAGTLRASVDWFDINLEGAISTLGGAVINQRCNDSGPAYDSPLCALVTRDPATQAITQIRNFNLNLNTLITRGWDVEVDYTLPLAQGSSLNLRVLGTFVKDLITIDTAGLAIDRAGQNGSGVSQPSGLPDYTINGFITYASDDFSAQLQVRHISDGLYDVTRVGPHQNGYNPLSPISINDNKVESVTYVNLNFQIPVWENGDRRMEFFGVVNNLFDKDPPKDLPSSFGPTNNVLYDVVGRYFRVGARVNF